MENNKRYIEKTLDQESSQYETFQEEAEKMCQYVLRMLGDDVLGVPLTKKTIVCAYEDAIERTYDNINGKTRIVTIRDYTLASCMEILARIYSKYTEFAFKEQTDILVNDAAKLKEKCRFYMI